MIKDREKILRKVKGLLDLAENNTSQEEMARALEQARKILQKYGLTMDEVNELKLKETLGVGDGWKIEVPSGNGKIIWVNHLAAITGEYFECKVGAMRDIFVFYGPALAAELAAYSFKSIYYQILELGDKYHVSKQEYLIKKSRKRHNIGSYSAYCRQAKYEYKTGLAVGLEKHLTKLKEEELNLVESNKVQAIVILSGNVADRWAKENHVILRSEQKINKTYKVTGTEHCNKGLKDSKNVHMRKGLSE